MSISEFITEIKNRTAPALQVGDFMDVEVDIFDFKRSEFVKTIQRGQVLSIGKSPFYGEEHIDAAYVGSLHGQPFWTTYILGEVR